MEQCILNPSPHCKAQGGANLSGTPRMSLKKRSCSLRLRISLILMIVLLFADRAGATQIHPAVEGYYVHQIGHLFFIISMGILVYWLRKRGLTSTAGWRWIQYSALFFILWNMDAVMVHFLDESNIIETVKLGGWSHYVRPVRGHPAAALFYYLGRMDHLLCVPAIVFLYLGLRKLLKQAERNGSGAANP